MTRSTRERIIDEALRLFAERGYSATSVAEIEAASGLSPGAGGLYRHFKSKYEVLAAAINEHATRTRTQVAESLAELGDMGARPTWRCGCRTCAAPGWPRYARSGADPVFFRDLSQFPELVAVVREGCCSPCSTPSRLVPRPARIRGRRRRLAGIAAVLGGSVVHYRLFQETVGEAPGHAERTSSSPPGYAWPGPAAGPAPGQATRSAGPIGGARVEQPVGEPDRPPTPCRS